MITRPRLRHLTLSFIIRHPTRLRADLLYEIIRGAGKPGFMSAMEALMTYDFRDRLPEVGCPTLVVWGREDGLVPARDADEFARLIPDSRKVVLEETGHVPMLERPAAFNGCLADFLSSAPETTQGEAATA